MKRKKISTKEKLERLIGRIVLLLIQSIVFTIIILGCLWLLGLCVNIMEQHLIIAIITGIIAFILIMKEV